MAGVGTEDKSVIKSREWYLVAYAAEGLPTSDQLKLRTVQLSPDSIPEGHVLLEVLFLSVDPYLRTRFSGLGDGLAIDQYQINQVRTPLSLLRT